MEKEEKRRSYASSAFFRFSIITTPIILRDHDGVFIVYTWKLELLWVLSMHWIFWRDGLLDDLRMYVHFLLNV